MSPVQPIESLTYTEPSLYEAKRPDELGKMDFLQLLTAQLEYQDPLDPQDPAEFTAQLTQFSNLEQMMALNGAIESLQMLQLSNNNTLAASLIGRDLLFAGDGIEIADGQAEEISFYTPKAVGSVTVHIYNEAGQIVRTINNVAGDAGMNTVQWNGRQGENASDPVLADGTYTFTVAGFDNEGNAVELTPLTRGRATGVYFEDGSTYLVVDGARVALSEVFSVNEAADTGGNDDDVDSSLMRAASAGRRASQDDGISVGDVARTLASTALKVAPLFL